MVVINKSARFLGKGGYHECSLVRLLGGYRLVWHTLASTLAAATPPDPWWFIDRIVGIIGGVIGGWLFTQAWPVDTAGELVWLAVAASGIGAFVGSLILLDLYLSFVRGRVGAPAPGGAPTPAQPQAQS